MQTQLILYGHGSRDPKWQSAFDDLAASVRAQVRDVGRVDTAFLQFISPSLHETVQLGVDQGVTRVHVVPIFLFPGQHVRFDIPEAIAQIRKEHPTLTVELDTPIGDHAAFRQIVTDRAMAVLTSEM